MNPFRIEKPLVALLSGLLPLPWWWVAPGLLGLWGVLSRAGLPLRCSGWRGPSWRSPCSCWREAGGWRRPTAVCGGLIGRTALPTL